MADSWPDTPILWMGSTFPRDAVVHRDFWNSVRITQAMYDAHVHPDDPTPDQTPPAAADRTLERFRTFLRIVADAPRDEAGHHLINPRALAYAYGEDVDPLECTPLSARWCPVHGDCTCSQAGPLDRSACPLHDPTSGHPQPEGL